MLERLQGIWWKQRDEVAAKLVYLPNTRWHWDGKEGHFYHLENGTYGWSTFTPEAMDKSEEFVRCPDPRS